MASRKMVMLSLTSSIYIYASCKARLKRLGNCLLSYLFIESGTIVSVLEWSEFSWLLNCTCSEGCGLQIRLSAHAT